MKFIKKMDNEELKHEEKIKIIDSFNPNQSLGKNDTFDDFPTNSKIDYKKVAKYTGLYILASIIIGLLGFMFLFFATELENPPKGLGYLGIVMMAIALFPVSPIILIGLFLAALNMATFSKMDIFGFIYFAFLITILISQSFLMLKALITAIKQRNNFEEYKVKIITHLEMSFLIYIGIIIYVLYMMTGNIANA